MGIYIDQAFEGAQICVLNLLVAIKQVTGSLDSVKRVISVTNYVNGTPDLTDSSPVINGASDLWGRVFGESGRHARSTVTVAALPSLNSAVETAAGVKLKWGVLTRLSLCTRAQAHLPITGLVGEHYPE